ncbi:hypothetical protein ACJMK2_044495 [Sinanodonta woodiana]|uniref:Uncharacterized protein n=1 Tax=Sinanodonta woodiana TaxID=1069815 RepID=A0ABD3W1M3_SINWO
MDRPDVLLQNPEGYFYNLVQQTGKSEAQKLEALAKKERNKTEDSEDSRQQPNYVTEEQNGDDECPIDVRI